MNTDTQTTAETNSPSPTIVEDSTEELGNAQAILFFDGVCGLCNHVIDFLLPRDRQNRLKFAPLQGETAAKLLTTEETTSLKTLIFRTGGKSYKRSSAAVRIMWALGGFWKILGGICWLIPKPLRDLGYMAISATRYRFFGKKESCRLPTEEERAKILP